MITDYTGSLVSEYPQFKELMEKQLDIFWLPTEPKVEKDIQDMRVNLTRDEYNGVVTTLKLFTMYEVFAGRDFWGDVVQKMFPKQEIVDMAQSFSMFELCVHKPFYQKINELLSLHTDDFYNEYQNDPVLSQRMQTISEILAQQDEESLILFAFVEGSVLYSSFAYLKHFQSEGKNKIMNIIRGINFSCRDESLHCIATTEILKVWFKEQGWDLQKYTKDVHLLCDILKEQEFYIIDLIFKDANIEGISREQCQNFFLHRLNYVCNLLGVEDYHVFTSHDDRSIEQWFYDGINGFTFNDQFTGVGNQYHRDWSETDFVYQTYSKGH